MSSIKTQLNQATPNQVALLIKEMQAGIGFLGGRYFFHKDHPREKLAFKEITKIFIDRCQNNAFIPSASFTDQLKRLNQEGNQLLNNKKGIAGILLRFFHALSQLFGNRFAIINHQSNIRLIESFISAPCIPSKGDDLPDQDIIKTDQEQTRLLAIYHKIEQERILKPLDLEFLANLKDIQSINFQAWAFPITIDEKQYNCTEFIETLLSKRNPQEPSDVGPTLLFRVNTKEARERLNELINQKNSKKLNFYLQIKEPPIVDVFEEDKISEVYKIYSSGFVESELNEAHKRLIIANFAQLPDARIAKNLPTLIASIRTEGDYLVCLVECLANNFQHICDDKEHLIDGWQEIIGKLREYDFMGYLYEEDLLKNAPFTLQFNLCKKLLDQNRLQHFLEVFKIIKFIYVQYGRCRPKVKICITNRVAPLWNEILRVGKDNSEFMYKMYQHVLHSNMDLSFQDPVLSYSFNLFKTEDDFQTFVTRFYAESKNKKEKFLLLYLLLNQSGINCERFETILQLYLEESKDTMSKLSFEECRLKILSPEIEPNPRVFENIEFRLFENVEFKLSAWFLQKQLASYQTASDCVQPLFEFIAKIKSYNEDLDLEDLFRVSAAIIDDNQAILFLDILLTLYTDSVGKRREEKSALRNNIEAFMGAIFSEYSYNEKEKREKVFNHFWNNFVRHIPKYDLDSRIFPLSTKMQKDFLWLTINQSISNADHLLHLMCTSRSIRPDPESIVCDLYVNNPEILLSTSNDILKSLAEYDRFRGASWVKDIRQNRVLNNLFQKAQKIQLTSDALLGSSMPSALISIIINYSEETSRTLQKHAIEILNQLKEIDFNNDLTVNNDILFQRIRALFTIQAQ